MGYYLLAYLYLYSNNRPRPSPVLLAGMFAVMVKYLNNTYRHLSSRQYDHNLKVMGIDQFEPMVLQVMHQMQASNMIIEKYDQDIQSRLKNKSNSPIANSTNR